MAIDGLTAVQVAQTTNPIKNFSSQIQEADVSILDNYINDSDSTASILESTDDSYNNGVDLIKPILEPMENPTELTAVYKDDDGNYCSKYEYKDGSGYYVETTSYNPHSLTGKIEGMFNKNKTTNYYDSEDNITKKVEEDGKSTTTTEYNKDGSYDVSTSKYYMTGSGKYSETNIEHHNKNGNISTKEEIETYDSSTLTMNSHKETRKETYPNGSYTVTETNTANGKGTKTVTKYDKYGIKISSETSEATYSPFDKAKREIDPEELKKIYM